MVGMAAKVRGWCLWVVVGWVGRDDGTIGTVRYLKRLGGWEWPRRSEWFVGMIETDRMVGPNQILWWGAGFWSGWVALGFWVGLGFGVGLGRVWGGLRVWAGFGVV